MNIYITKVNEERLALLKDRSKSGLINLLLDKYFDNEHIGIVADEQKKVDTFVGTVPELVPPVAKNISRGAKQGPSTADPATDPRNYCEHGQLKGECLVKGCKYAKR